MKTLLILVEVFEDFLLKDIREVNKKNMKLPENFKLLVSEQELKEAIKNLGARLNQEYDELSVVGIMNGSVFFFADLMRELTMPIKMDTIVASSYSGTSSTQEVIFSKKITKPIIEGREVIIVEDVIDTGLTLTEVYKYLLTLKPKSLRIITLFDKTPCHPNFPYPYESIFKTDDKFLVGYGFEVDDLYRQLPKVYYIDQK
ncbi:phosphoribosyltransferase [Entomoplasma freundtii]|nr:phosphoribosyltransferase family protein [Entomoplasma freundtii]